MKLNRPALTIFLMMSLLDIINGDIYLHNPRGSNNRCDRRTNDRANANRLFDSQNNAAGGYAIPCDRIDSDNINCYKMQYYMNSELEFRWTSQHNCGIQNNCQMILQYSCDNLLGDNVRDGKPQNINGNTCEDTIPLLPDDEITNMAKYGRHENFGYYQKCINSFRNPMLFTSDQKLRGNRAIYTRQNPNGNRYGFECPEERDYFPYWRDSPWIDIAMITNVDDLCELYYNNSQNIHNKKYCTGASKYIFNLTECEEYGGHIITVPSFKELNLTSDRPECITMPESALPNRLGESVDYYGNLKKPSTHQSYIWKIPHFNTNLSNCIIRIRYNISTNEVMFNFTSNDNYKLRNNPQVNTTFGVPVRLAVDTSQYGRTFEDRTFTFDIIKSTIPFDKKIININVQGKRGNIAQVRNCVEYDFVPNNITVKNDDYIHFQWVGSDYNPPENEGEGRAGTDRSNLVFIDDIKDNIPSLTKYNQPFENNILILLASIGQPYYNNTLCKSPNNDEQSLDNCAILNYASPYFNIDPIKISINKTKTYYAFSTRNNNFSNRDQKLTLKYENKNSSEYSQASQSHQYKNKGLLIGLIFLGMIISIILIGIGLVMRKKQLTLKKLKTYLDRNLSSSI